MALGRAEEIASEFMALAAIVGLDHGLHSGGGAVAMLIPSPFCAHAAHALVGNAISFVRLPDLRPFP